VRATASLGTNPWNLATANQNLASLAEEYGGGGHQRVAAISFDRGDIARAREVAHGIVNLLRKPAN
jgi:nanoRNase/pAp phosphatase (c-di-AMP/oligoRNAs hydrolase)